MSNGTVIITSQPWTLTLPSIFQFNTHADVYFECEGKRIAVHKTVLASQSSFFRELLLNVESPLEIPVLYLEGFRYDILVLVVSFLYNGRVEGSSEDLITLSKYGKELQIEGLVNSGRTTQPLQLEMLEQKKIRVNEQLCQLQESDSDSDGAESADEDELMIVFEKSKCEDKREKPHQSSMSQTTTTPELQKRPFSPTSSNLRKVKRRCQKSATSDSPSKTTVADSLKSRTIKCRLCREVSFTKQDFRSHLAEKHAEKLTCTICSRLFTARSSLKTHLKNHINKLDSMLNCVPSSHLDSNVLLNNPCDTVNRPVL